MVITGAATNNLPMKKLAILTNSLVKEKAIGSSYLLLRKYTTPTNTAIPISV